MVSHGSFVSQSLTGFPASPSAARGLSHHLKFKADSVTLVLSYAIGSLAFRARPNPCEFPNPDMTHHCRCPFHTQCSDMGSSLPLPQGAQYRSLFIFFLEQDGHTPTLGPIPFSLKGTSLLQLRTWLPLTSGLLQVSQEHLCKALCMCVCM